MHGIASVIIVIHLMLVIAMVGVVLLQKSEGGGLVSSSSGFLTGRGTANVLTRTTALLAAGFFLTSLALSWFASYDRKSASIITPAGQESPAGPPTAPLNQGKGGLLGTLSGGIPNAPAGPPQNPPAAPSGPQVPQSH
jgi:preprotein translocase subunit SecG